MVKKAGSNSASHTILIALIRRSDRFKRGVLGANWRPDRHQAELLSAKNTHLSPAVLVFPCALSSFPQRYPQPDKRNAFSRTPAMKRKPTRCAICNHREHAAIDLALARGVSVCAIARRYKVSTDSCYRHSNHHLPPQLRAKLIAGPSIEGVDLDRLRDVESQSLLSHLVNLRNRLFASLDVAEECGDSAGVARFAAQLHSNFELVAKLLGDLATGSTNITNILVAPQYVQMRVELVRALQPYPEARLAVAKVLHALESKAADAIKADEAKGLAS